MYIVTTFTAAHAATPANSAAQLRSLDSKWAKRIGIVKYLPHTYKSRVHNGTGYIKYFGDFELYKIVYIIIGLGEMYGFPLYIHSL